MKFFTWIVRNCFLAVMLLLGSNSDGRNVQEALNALLNTHYCGTAMMDGMGPSTALRGKTIISDNTYFDVPEEEWLPVLLQMAEEELEACKMDTVEDIAEIRGLEAELGSPINPDDERTRNLSMAYTRVETRRSKLRDMIVYLRHAEGGTAQVLDLLERIGLESPREFSIVHNVNDAVVDKACRDGVFERCIGLGRQYRQVHGLASEEEWNLCKEFALLGIPQLALEADVPKGCQYVTEFGDTVSDSNLGQRFDRLAANVLPGWAGSLQRRRLAERCLASTETREGEMPAERIQRVCPWAAAELAADESDLTDLREVYGDWTKDGEEK